MPPRLSLSSLRLQSWPGRPPFRPTSTGRLAEGHVGECGAQPLFVLGSDPGKFKQVIVLRNLLLLYGISTGLVAGLVLFAFEDDIFTLFHVHDGHTKDLLILVWPILSFMQIINACVFVLDGLIYAAQAFSFVRNLMFVACVLVFSPAIFVVTTVSAYHSLFYLWIGKTCLNSVRAVGAFWLWFYSFPSSWRSERRVNSAPPIG